MFCEYDTIYCLNNITCEIVLKTTIKGKIMNYIVDKNGKELNGKSNHKKRSWISQNMIAALTMIPIAGAMVNFIVKLYIYIYKMGYSSYFQIPNEYLLINYNITIYNMIIVGSISVVYCMCSE